MERVNHRVPVIAGTGSNDTAYGIELSQYACEVGADALLLVTPYYNKATQKGLIAHYTMVADASSVPVILYNVPSRTGMTIQPATYLELSKHPNIVATKEASGNISAVAKNQDTKEEKLKVKLNGFNSIFAVSSIEAAKLYYMEFKKQMAARPEDALKIATIYSYGQNEDDPDGFIDDEESDNTDGLDLTSRESNALSDKNSSPYIITNFAKNVK